MDTNRHSTNEPAYHSRGVTRTEFVILAGILLVSVAVFVPLISKARDEARLTQSKNNLKQIGLALHNFHDVHGRLPQGGVVDANGRGVHGWPYQIIPFLYAGPLFSQIDPKQPWDEIPNRFRSMTPQPGFLIPGEEPAFVNGYPTIQYAINPAVAHRNGSKSFPELSVYDNVWLCTEVAGNFRPWADPFNWRKLGFSNGPDSAGHPSRPGAHVLLKDGSVRWLDETADAQVIRQFANSVPLPVADLLEQQPWQEFYGNVSVSYDRFELPDPNPVSKDTPHLFAIRHDERIEFLEIAVVSKDDQPESKLTDIKAALQKYPQARAVSIPGAVSDSFAKELCRFRQMKVLVCGSLEISAAGTKAIAAHPRLRALYIENVLPADHPLRNAKSKLRIIERK